MLDTRIEGRDQQYDNFGDADGGFGRYIAGVTPNASGVLPDATRRMMSATQQSWLASQMSASRATWQVLGNQDIMGKMWIPVSVTQNFNSGNAAGFAAATQAYLTAKATRAAGVSPPSRPLNSLCSTPRRTRACHTTWTHGTAIRQTANVCCSRLRH